MIDFPSNPVDGAVVTAGRKKWQFVAATSTWDLVSTPDQAASDTMAAAQAAVSQASGYATDAGTSAAAAAGSRSAIDNRIYPGLRAADPLTRPDGSAIQNGDVYTMTTGTMRMRIAGAWQDWTTASAIAAAASAAAAAGSSAAALTAQHAAENNALIAGQAVAVVGGSTATKLSAAIGMAYRNGYQQRPKYELYIPQITSLAQLTNPVGLAIHASGVGVVAAVNGTNGTATIPSPANIDRTQPFIFAVKFELNENVNAAFLQLSNATKDYWSGPRMSVIKQDQISAGAGNNTTFSAVQNPSVDGGTSAGGTDGLIPAGTQFWWVTVGDGLGAATQSLIPDIPLAALDTAPLKGTQLGYKPKYNRINYVPEALSNVSAGAGKFTYGDTSIPSTLLTQVYMQNASATTRILGVYLCVGEIAGPPDFKMGAPCVVVSTVAQEPLGAGSQQTLLLPNGYGGPRDTTLVMHMHPNANPGAIGQGQSMGVVAPLFYAGYAQASLTGAQNSAEYAGATSSNFGAPTGLVYRRLYEEWLRSRCPFLGRMVMIGSSMGLDNSLRYHAEYGGVTAIVGVSGVTDLTDTYNNVIGMAAVINNAYGAWYRSKSAANTGNDPETNPAKWDRINAGVLAVNPRYLLAPQNWKTGAPWAAGTTYAENDVVFKAYTGGIASLSPYDPRLNPSKFTGVPIKLWHGDADTLISINQMTNFAAAVNAAGGSVQTVVVPGGTHVGPTMYDPVGIQAFFDQYRDL